MKEVKCNICDKKFGSEESLKQHNQAVHSNVKEKKSMKKYFLIAVLFLALVLFSYAIYVSAQKPGKYDNFAKCLTEKGAIIYGNDFCPYTVKQLNFFGKSKEYLNYVKCVDNEALCNSKGVKITPTWEINSKMYEQVQTFERLSDTSGCEI